MHSEGNRHPLETTLAQEVECSRQLMGCLDSERSALIERDLDALETTTQQKLDCSQQLEQLETRRGSLVESLGFENTPDSLQRCFKTLPCAERLSTLWQQVLGNIESCRATNLSNGSILESGRQHVEQALCILRGQTGAPSVYAQDGETRANLGQRELGKV
ncbi:flagellar biosynthesis/type III secretory pathway chaperone [Thiogranum longum]|uniref:Flagellar biosynthesis/type III secretory pathway chaperone n=1 Tax=Thiogranum longum TaxID=1537524 RepID=A0A4V2PH12_9GAMM|nr:flagellar protein FlgN [Thiogranum longum]TCK18876.1 flagellar biosynthesis/type III secretory pathway chaperone [Thiogranum longum]